MTPEQQQIAIAEACGWKYEPRRLSINGILIEDSYPWISPTGARDYISQLPDYLTDLNAMHEAEKLIMLHPHAAKTRCRYHAYLADLCKIDAIHATAPQRAEAFLRTLNLYIP